MATDETELEYPNAIEVFMPLLDGVHPIVPVDLNDMSRVLNSLQDVLGYDTSAAYGVGTGPKGSNADVAERLDAFIDDEGALNDVALVTFETRAGSLSELLGVFIPFGRSMSTTDYRVLIQVFSDETKEGGTGNSQPSLITPAHLWIGTKSSAGLLLYARTIDGYILLTSATEKVTIALLIFGPGVSA